MHQDPETLVQIQQSTRIPCAPEVIGGRGAALGRLVGFLPCFTHEGASRGVLSQPHENGPASIVRIASNGNGSASASHANLRKQLLAILSTQVGVQEVPLGSNDGPQVREYLHAAGANVGDPWCAAIQHWAFNRIGEKGHGAYCPNWFPASHVVANEFAAPGDQMGVYFASKHRIAHMGTITAVRRREVETIEGNTNAQGSREGDRCARRIRDREQIIVGRWLPL